MSNNAKTQISAKANSSASKTENVQRSTTKKRHRRRHGRGAATDANNGNPPISKTGAVAVLTPNANRRIAGANWNAAAGGGGGGGGGVGQKANDNGGSNAKVNVNVNGTAAIPPKKARSQAYVKPTKYVAMDCEMVGIGFQGRDDMLARVSIVDEVGDVLLDKFVKPVEIITDYRTPVSGIRPLDVNDGEEFSVVQKEVISILSDRILVGHNLKKDLQVLHITHPYRNIRDTSNYKPLARLVSSGGKTPSLKRLSAKILGREIQTGEHNSVEDARAAMNVYRSVATDWENSLKNKFHRKH